MRLSAAIPDAQINVDAVEQEKAKSVGLAVINRIAVFRRSVTPFNTQSFQGGSYEPKGDEQGP